MPLIRLPVLEIRIFRANKEVGTRRWTGKNALIFAFYLMLLGRLTF
jgi:hypothetical protein